jgi:hypothetical protein
LRTEQTLADAALVGVLFGFPVLVDRLALRVDLEDDP